MELSEASPIFFPSFVTMFLPGYPKFSFLLFLIILLDYIFMLTVFSQYLLVPGMAIQYADFFFCLFKNFFN